MKSIATVIETVSSALGNNFYTLDTVDNKVKRLVLKAVFIAVIKEEGYRNRDIINHAKGWNHQQINYAEKIFNDFIITCKLTKELYLKAVKAVEDCNDED